jgi:hypothetical protein
MLGAADALVRSRLRPRRSVVFIATTAEESGLLGSAAWAADPLVPLDRSAAVVNLDHTNVRGMTRDISALGADRSTLGATLAAAARAESLTVVETRDERGSFFRSDHFPLARVGIPALSLQRGEDYVGRSREWAAEQETLWNTRRYHQPSDEYSRFRLCGDGAAGAGRGAYRAGGGQRRGAPTVEADVRVPAPPRGAVNVGRCGGEVIDGLTVTGGRGARAGAPRARLAE